MRGLVYFVGNHFFGQSQNGLSVPLVTEPFQPGDMPSRATIDEVKAQVIADLKEAEVLMEGIESNNGKATVWAVRGLFARVYFEYKDYANAEAYANMVIESGKFSLIDGDVAAAFSSNITTENVFTFLGIATDRAADNLFERFSLNSTNVQLSLSDAYWDLISKEGNDKRVSDLHMDLGAGGRLSQIRRPQHEPTIHPLAGNILDTCRGKGGKWQSRRWSCRPQPPTPKRGH